MQTVNNNKPEQINSALFAISDDITKQNIRTKNAIKASEAGLQKQIDKLTDSLQNNGGLITGGTYDINISGNASTATNATNATNADKATKDSAGNTIATTYAKKTEVPTKTSQLTNDSSFVTSGQLATVATSGSYNDLSGTPTIPTKTSQLTNDSSFVTSGQLATVATSGSYNDLSGTPTIPTNISQLTNDSGYITSSGSCNYANSAGTANRFEDENNVVQYKATSLNGYTIQDNQAKALYVEGRESNNGDSGGIAITNDGVTVFGAGDTDGVLRVINEDNVQAGPVFKVMKDGQVYTTNIIHGSIDGNAATANTATNVTNGVAHAIRRDIGLDTNKAYMSMVECAPDGQANRWWHIITDTWENADTVWKAQIAYPTYYSADNNGDKGKAMWYRWKNSNNSWGAWQRLARFDEIPTSIGRIPTSAPSSPAPGDIWIE